MSFTIDELMPRLTREVYVSHVARAMSASTEPSTLWYVSCKAPNSDSPLDVQKVLVAPIRFDESFLASVGYVSPSIQALKRLVDEASSTGATIVTYNYKCPLYSTNLVAHIRLRRA